MILSNKYWVNESILKDRMCKKITLLAILFPMKKLLIFIFLLSSIVIIWCSGTKNNDFDNKKNCFSIQDDWQKDYFANGACSQGHYVMEVIYSKKHNSCLAHYSCRNGDYVIMDMLSKKRIVL